MAHPPVRGEDGTTSERPNYEPCEAELDPPGWPSLERVGTIREPRATVVHGNGNMSFYPGQCVADRCGVPRSLVPSRGQVLDHVGFVVRDVGAWHAWLTARGVGILEDIHEIPEGRAFMIEGPDRLAIELVEVGTPLLAQTPPAWTEPIEPFRIAEDLYWVGTAGLASYLLTSDQGHVLIDVPLEENVPRVLESIRALGFEPRDVRIVLTSHAHFDHVGGVAGLLEATGAELVVSEADAPFLRSGTDFGLGSRYPAAAPARTVGHLETVRLGDLALTAHLTPGHTPGCTTWSGTVRIDGEPFAWVSACSLSVLSAYRLVGPDATYAGHGADYCRSIAHLRTLDPDVFLSAHGEFFGMAEKRAALLAGDETAFVEREGYHAWVGEALVGIERALAAQGHEGGCAALVG
jgi:metallo-beta-lactamase class B